MECGGSILSSFLNTRRRTEKLERSELFMENGSQLLEEFITSWNGRCSIPIPNFSAEELIRATNNFDFLNRVDEDAFYTLYRGSFGERPILVKYYGSPFYRDSRPLGTKACAVRDIAMTSQMSGHKNVVKLIGRCLEFEHPALVFEDVRGTKLLSRTLFKREERDMVNHYGSLLSLKSRVSIANDIAYVFVHLQTAFSTPILHRNLKSNQVIIDGCGVAKLLDFSLSIAIPPGKSQVEAEIAGTRGMIETQYVKTGILTEKTDVYDFGMILVELLAGRRITDINFQYGWFEDYVHEGRLNEIVDARIRGEGGGGGGVEQQLQALMALARRCLEKEREDRPEMIDVAKEPKRIQRLVQP